MTTTKTFSLDREGDAGFLPVVIIDVSGTSLKYMWKNGRWYKWDTDDRGYHTTHYVCDFSRELTDTDSEGNAHGILSPTDGKVTFWRGKAFVEVDINAVDFDGTANLVYLGAIITGNALRVTEAFKTKYPAVKSSHIASFSV